MDQIEPNGAAPWPAGHRAALCIVLLLVGPRAERSGAGTLFAAEPYGATGLISLLGLLEDLDLRVTVAPDEDGAQAYAPSLRRCHLSGHEVAVALTSARTTSAERTMEAVRHITGSAPRGLVVGSASLVDPATQNWPEWQLTSAATDLPTLLERGSDAPPLVTLPGSPFWVDANWLSPDYPLPPSSLLEAWTLSIDDARAAGSLMTVVVHPHLFGRPGLRATLGRFLDETISSGDVWIAPATDIAGWWLSRHDGD